MAQTAPKTEVLKKLEEINAQLTLLTWRSENPKVEKAFEELRKEQAATKKELQEMREMAEAMRQDHKAIKALLDSQAGTEARQAGTEARQAEPETFEASQAQLHGKRKGGEGRPVGAKKYAEGEEKPMRESRFEEPAEPHAASCDSCSCKFNASLLFKLLEETEKAERASAMPKTYKWNLNYSKRAAQQQRDEQAGQAPPPTLQDHLGKVAAPPSVINTSNLCKMRNREEASPAPRQTLAGILYPIIDSQAHGAHPVRETEEEKVIRKLRNRVNELERQQKQDEQSLEKYRAQSDKSGTLREENERLKAQMANFKAALGIEEHTLQFDMDELKDKMVGAKMADQPSTSAEPPRQETSDEDDFEKVKEDEKEEEEA